MPATDTRTAPLSPAPTHEPLAVAVGDATLHPAPEAPTGTIVDIGGTAYYRIEDVDAMPPFFVTVVSADDHWMFVSSRGPLSAGRCSPDHPLFPYTTVDKIHDSQDRTGSKTLLLVQAEDTDRQRLWEPFSDRYTGVYSTRRSLAKSLTGDRLRFEEVNEDLGLTFAITWLTSERFGIVKRSELTAHAASGARVRVLDGVQNLMPYGITRDLQDTRSVLADAYKKSERVPGLPLGIFSLSAIPVDRAEPSEALMGTTVWSAGLEPATVLLSARQLDTFRAGQPLAPEAIVRAERGAYFVEATLNLDAGESHRWSLVAEIEQDAADVVGIMDLLDSPEALGQALDADIENGSARLRALVATADGEQHTADPMTTARHRMNVLFNIMRGGIFDDGTSIVRDDVRAFVAGRNADVASENADFFDALPERLSVQALHEASRARSPQVHRLCMSYLPLSFSRRHGDPSRPWNEFTIDVRGEDGSVTRGYEGNWRDIFQNWEALGRSFPDFVEGMIATFVNASTADGYNPYRITDAGIDWEKIEPDDPWSYIGYWGDHQIIYLLRLLAVSRAHHPGRLETLLARRYFSYANVPYRIKPYADLLRNPHDTVVYDEAEEERIAERVDALGADGRLLLDASGQVRLVTLAEKLLVPLLAKLSNFIPGGGIWMNTQRPEWNDANNALVGNGVSVVTLFAIRRYVDFLRDLFAGASGESAEISADVAEMYEQVAAVFDRSDALADLDDAARREIVDALGRAGSEYRQRLYQNGLSDETRTLAHADLVAFLGHVENAVDATLAANHRADGLVQSYNLMAVGDGTVEVSHLYAMLEGQVAALDAGALSPEGSADLLDALRASALYRPDQHSYLLYPDRSLPGFLDKNVVPPEAVAASPLMQALLASGDTSVVVRDVRGGVHFNGTFRNRHDVEAALNALRAGEHADAVDQGASGVLDAFEGVFDHRAYTGRSGTFFGYEGLGSIYWHMVSKLALATQETTFRALAAGADPAVIRRLADAYYDIRAGLGVHKTPEVFGAFPADAYSHTPGHSGAKQPGMTGQVKEDVICRWGELGVLVENGSLVFRPLLLRSEEFLTAPEAFEFVDVRGDTASIELDAGALAFTYCQVPVVYRRADRMQIRVVRASGETVDAAGSALAPDTSAEVFGRTGTIDRIEVDLTPGR